MVKISLAELLENVPCNETIGNNLIKAYNIVCGRGYEKILCSVSGGSDSDVMIDILTKMRDDIDYVWFDTGMEYKATKEHLTYLEEKYHINIERKRAIKSIPVSCKEYGQPFMSKHTSEMMSRLQRHGFEWEDKPYEIGQFNINHASMMKRLVLITDHYFGIPTKTRKNIKHFMRL